MNAGIAGELVAKFIEKQWPSDRKDIWEVLRLGINKAWQEGKWLGMTAEFFVEVLKDVNGQSYFIAPPSHSILLAINGNKLGINIRDPYFMFHKNAYADVRDAAYRGWNQDVYDIGSQPYLDKDNINFSCGVKVGVRSIGVPGPDESVLIDGAYLDGNSIYTYKSKNYGEPCGCGVDKDLIDTVRGVQIPITKEFNYINNISFASIRSISKSLTRTPVEIIAIDENNKGHLISKMEPNQRFSNYRKYLVPDDLFGKPYLHALFKVSKQDYITSVSDNIIIKNEEALIALAKGIYNIYYKENQDLGTSFILQGINVLEKDKREEESPDIYPIQVDGPMTNDIPEIFKYNS